MPDGNIYTISRTRERRERGQNCKNKNNLSGIKLPYIQTRRIKAELVKSWSELLVNVPGVVHEFAPREVLAVLQDLVQLQVVVLVLVGHGDHLTSLVQGVVLVHRVHVLLMEDQRHFSHSE